jgi:hypothetical protein
MGTMSIPQSILAPWTRKHDKPGTPLISGAPVTFFPRNLEDLITLCQQHPPNHRLHAAGSHWALSKAALADNSFIETHDFHNIFPAMGRTLFDVIPGCLADEFLIELNSVSDDVGSARSYLVHFESGKRMYQLYAELDVGDSNNPASLAAVMKARFGNRLFDGSWAFATLGGAGGQTVVGALSTGTHGGDFDRPRWPTRWWLYTWWPTAGSISGLSGRIPTGHRSSTRPSCARFTASRSLAARTISRSSTTTTSLTAR